MVEWFNAHFSCQNLQTSGCGYNIGFIWCWTRRIYLKDPAKNLNCLTWLISSYFFILHPLFYLSLYDLVSLLLQMFFSFKDASLHVITCCKRTPYPCRNMNNRTNTLQLKNLGCMEACEGFLVSLSFDTFFGKLYRKKELLVGRNWYPEFDL